MTTPGVLSSRSNWNGQGLLISKFHLVIIFAVLEMLEEWTGFAYSGMLSELALKNCAFVATFD